MGEKVDIETMKMVLCSSEEEFRKESSSIKENSLTSEHSLIKENPLIKCKNKERNSTEIGEKSKKSLFTTTKEKEERNKDRIRRMEGKRISQQGMNTLTSYRSNKKENSSTKENSLSTEYTLIKENAPIKGKAKEGNSTEIGEKSKKSLFTTTKEKEERYNDRNRRTERKRICEQGMNITSYRSRSALNMMILHEPNDKGELEMIHKRKISPERNKTPAGKLINTEHKRSKVTKIIDQREATKCKKTCYNINRANNSNNRKEKPKVFFFRVKWEKKRTRKGGKEETCLTKNQRKETK